MNKEEIKQKIIQNKKDIKESLKHLGTLHRYRDYLVAMCSRSGHIIVPRDKKFFEETGSTIAICEVCEKDFGWYCPDSSDHYCHYEEDSECCIYCGQPEERK